jgi:hypothetical protein
MQSAQRSEVSENCDPGDSNGPVTRSKTCKMKDQVASNPLSPRWDKRGFMGRSGKDGLSGTAKMRCDGLV